MWAADQPSPTTRLAHACALVRDSVLQYKCRCFPPTFSIFYILLQGYACRRVAISEHVADQERFYRHSSKRSKRRLGSRYEYGTPNLDQSSIHWKQAEASCVKVGNFPSKESNQESLNMNSGQPKHMIRPLKNEDSKSDESAENNRRHPQKASREGPLRARTATQQASPPDSIYNSHTHMEMFS